MLGQIRGSDAFFLVLGIKYEGYKYTHIFQICSCYFNLAARTYRKKYNLKEDINHEKKNRKEKQLYKFNLETRCLFLAVRIIRH